MLKNNQTFIFYIRIQGTSDTYTHDTINTLYNSNLNNVKFHNKMVIHKLTLTEISWVTILCRHRDSNPRPSDSRLLAGHWFPYRDLQLSEWSVCPYWSPVQVFFSCFRPTKRSAPRFRSTIESGNVIRLSFLLFQVDPTLSIELERAQHFRASGSGLGWARAQISLGLLHKKSFFQLLSIGPHRAYKKIEPG